MSATAQPTASTSVRNAPNQPVLPPSHITENMSLLDYLRACTPSRDGPIIKIALSQTNVPDYLRDDAAQEIRILWMRIYPDVEKFKLGQILSYAHRMARNAALKLRRDMGSSVRLPGSAFRARPDGSSYVTPGVLAAPLSWSDVEAWMLTEDGSDGLQGGNLDPDFMNALTTVESMVVTPGEDEDSLAREEEARRLALLEDRRAQLTDIQYECVRLLVTGHSYEDVMQRLNIKRASLINAANVVAELFESEFDD
jgi:hypothetical protein